MKQRLGHLLAVAAVGATCLTALAFAKPDPSGLDLQPAPAQDPARDAERPVQEPTPGAEANPTTGLEDARQRFRRAVAEHVEREAREQHLRVEPRSLAVTLAGQGLVAGVSVAKAAEGGEPPPSGGGDDEIGLCGLLVLAGPLTSATGAAGEPGTYRVFCPASARSVELRDENGQVAMRFPLIDRPPTAGEAGAPRDVNARAALSTPQWNVVYASILAGLLTR